MESTQPQDLSPSQPFRANNQAQFAPSQYPYPPSTSAGFPIDHDMTMEHFAVGVQNSTVSGVADGMAVTSAPSHHTPTHTTTANSSISGPGMAPPQSASAQPYSPTDAHQSIDDTLDHPMSGGDPKRKRSKVSRACDECRRKKVRCDAAADDGTIKTCSNCQRSGILCGYNRVPMKRGPSKGYIKELSERVQQVESQMALSSTPGLPGYRQSLDGSTAMYTEQLYSPEDPSFKRNFSFSDRSPFANPDFNRDRMPSVGGWISGTPQTTGFRGRDRGSVAIAPDQQSPMPSSKPFWVQDMNGSPPAKRRRIDVGADAAPTMGRERLDEYYRMVHSNLPILPDVDSVISVTGKTDIRVQHAFCAVVDRLKSPSSTKLNGLASGKDSSSADHFFHSYGDLEEFMWNAARENPDQRSDEDNLVYLWTYLLMVVVIENDLSKFRDGLFSKAILLKHVIDLSWQCIQDAGKPIQHGDTTTSTTFKEYLARIWYCAGILARLHALAVGASNPVPHARDTPLPRPHQIFPPDLAFLALSSICMSTILVMIKSRPYGQDDRHQQIEARDTVLTLLDNVLCIAQLPPECETTAKRVELFFELLLSRHANLLGPMDVLRPTIALAEILTTGITTSADRDVYDPLKMHLFILIVITLLEFTQDGVKEGITKLALTALAKVSNALEELAERNHMKEQTRKHDTNQDSQGNNGLDDTTKQRESNQPSSTHWANMLLVMIDRRRKAVSIGVDIDVAAGNGSTSEVGETNGAPTNEQTVSVDFSMLLQYGYLNVLIESVGV